ncbi:MAG: family 43 glycosylhydrolase [Clostridiales bacterium]|nr:family 43 glycosylhydrolase [Clostridiales bacterium]
MLYTNPDLRNFAKDPAVVELGGYYFLYHSVMENGVLGVGISRSIDGDSFERVAILPRTLECERTGVGAPAAIRIGDEIHLFYQTYGTGKLDAICHAVSTDGINFVKDESNPIFAPREPFADMPEWACGRAIDADVCIFGGRLILYFATRDKAFKRQIVGAASAPLDSGFGRGSFELFPEIVLEPILDWEQDCIEAPAALVRDGKVYLFYAGAYNCKPQQIGCAVSEDGFHFKRLFIDEPLLTNGKSGEWNSSESGHPYIYEADDGRVWLYYQGSSDMGKSWYLSRCEIEFMDGIPAIKK